MRFSRWVHCGVFAGLLFTAACSKDSPPRPRGEAYPEDAIRVGNATEVEGYTVTVRSTWETAEGDGSGDAGRMPHVELSVTPPGQKLGYEKRLARDDTFLLGKSCYRVFRIERSPDRAMLRSCTAPPWNSPSMPR